MPPTLIGMYDSPYVRRVAITMHFYEIAYQHQPWSVFGDADQVSAHNPLGRVPILLLENDEALVESSAILDYLDQQVDPDQALTPTHGVARRRTLKQISIAVGACDKAVALSYERKQHATVDSQWEARLIAQLDRACQWLEAQLPEPRQRPDQAQLTTAVLIRFIAGYHPQLKLTATPRLGSLAERCEAMPQFQAAPFAS